MKKYSISEVLGLGSKSPVNGLADSWVGGAILAGSGITAECAELEPREALRQPAPFRA